jgi:hypothetical protein
MCPAEADVAGADDRRGAVGHLELREDRGDVVGDRFRCHAEPPRDDTVRQASGEQVELTQVLTQPLRQQLRPSPLIVNVPTLITHAIGGGKADEVSRSYTPLNLAAIALRVGAPAALETLHIQRCAAPRPARSRPTRSPTPSPPAATAQNSASRHPRRTAASPR